MGEVPTQYLLHWSWRQRTRWLGLDSLITGVVRGGVEATGFIVASGRRQLVQNLCFLRGLCLLTLIWSRHLHVYLDVYLGPFLYSIPHSFWLQEYPTEELISAPSWKSFPGWIVLPCECTLLKKCTSLLWWADSTTIQSDLRCTHAKYLLYMMLQRRKKMWM